MTTSAAETTRILSSRGSLAVLISTGIVVVAEIAVLWAVAARRPTRDDVFGPAQVIAASPGGSVATAGAPDVNPKIWSSDGAEISSLQFAPNDRFLAATLNGNVGKRVLLIEIETGNLVVNVPVDRRVLSCFTTASDTLAIYTAHVDFPAHLSDGIVTIYRVEDGTKEVETAAPNGWQLVKAIGLSQNGRILAAHVYPWNPESREAFDIQTQQPVPYESGDYLWSSGHLSPDGELYSMGGWPGPGVRIRRFGSAEAVSFCLRDALPAVASSFSDDSRLWATAYDDGALVVWDIHEIGKAGRPLLIKDGFSNCTAFAMSHDLTRLAYANNDGSLRITPLDLPALE
jgi:WD40 repeat protein